MSNVSYRKRLLNVARALRESPAPDRFTMEQFGWVCGTPACGLGHYAARRDLQRSFTLARDEAPLSDIMYIRDARGNEATCHGAAVRKHFGIERREADELFGSTGCGNAATAVAAAAYIEDFVARKWGAAA